MLGTIEKAVMNLLWNAYGAVCAGGTEYPAGFPGLTRERTQQAISNTGTVLPAIGAPTKGYVNIFDRPYTKDSDNSRPGIYIGLGATEASDEQEYRTVSSGKRVSLRVIRFPIVIVCDDNSLYVAREMRNQLRANIKQVFFKNPVGQYWYLLDIPGRTGGGDLQERNWSSGGGQAGQGVAEAITVMPIAVSYQYSEATIEG